MRALLTADRPMGGPTGQWSDVQTGSRDVWAWEHRVRQVGRQQAGRMQLGLPCERGVASLQLLPAGASVCGLRGRCPPLDKLACLQGESRGGWLLVSKQVSGREPGAGRGQGSHLHLPGVRH